MKTTLFSQKIITACKNIEKKNKNQKLLKKTFLHDVGDFFKQDPVFTLDFGKSVLHQLLFFLSTINQPKSSWGVGVNEMSHFHEFFSVSFPILLVYEMRAVFIRHRYCPKHDFETINIY